MKRHLENLGFVEGSNITVVSVSGGNVIVNVKESRIAISKEMAIESWCERGSSAIAAIRKELCKR